jgi:hypothetical protein
LYAGRDGSPLGPREVFEAEFDSGIGAAFEGELVRAAVREAERLPAILDIRYAMAIDSAFTGDTFAAIVGHAEPSGRVMVDVVPSPASSVSIGSCTARRP